MFVSFSKVRRNFVVSSAQVRSRLYASQADLSIDVKKRFFTFFILVTFFIFQTFFIFKKNLDKVQSGKQTNKKHFQNYSNEIEL